MSKEIVPVPRRGSGGLIKRAQNGAGKIWFGVVAGAIGITFLPTATLVVIGAGVAYKLVKISRS